MSYILSRSTSTSPRVCPAVLQDGPANALRFRCTVSKSPPDAADGVRLRLWSKTRSKKSADAPTGATSRFLRLDSLLPDSSSGGRSASSLCCSGVVGPPAFVCRPARKPAAALLGRRCASLSGPLETGLFRAGLAVPFLTFGLWKSDSGRPEPTHRTLLQFLNATERTST